ncbi:hypothetical protein H5410_051362 [Solanum commersonii]|uniref:Uncharacterized protein n=1 Tax=Solanum commersonii TaxID=4109 RepID=A0A9J5WZC5_SOLCO|nr:hypothetical protein H5410_051362 [Solanum commersonii]
MAIEGDINAASTTNVRLNGGKKARKGKRHQKSHEEMLLDPTPSEALTSHPPSTPRQLTMTMARSPLTSSQDQSGSQGLKWRGRP